MYVFINALWTSFDNESYIFVGTSLIFVFQACCFLFVSWRFAIPGHLLKRKQIFLFVP